MGILSKSLMALGVVEAASGIVAAFALAASTGIVDPSPGMAGVGLGGLTFMAGAAMQAAENSSTLHAVNKREK